MDDIKGHIAANKCPGFYKEEIKTPQKPSVVKRIVVFLRIILNKK